MEKNPFLKRLMKDESKDIVHSSAYAQAQNAEGMGAASTQSFEARRAIEQSRKMVRGYRDSKVVNELGDGVVKAARFDANKDTSQRTAIKERLGINSRGASSSANSSTGLVGRAPSTPPARRNPGISR